MIGERQGLIQQEILRVIETAETRFVRINASKIARLTGVHQSTVSRIAETMVKDGIIKRKRPGWYFRTILQQPESPTIKQIVERQKVLEDRLDRIESMLSTLLFKLTQTPSFLLHPDQEQEEVGQALNPWDHTLAGSSDEPPFRPVQSVKPSPSDDDDLDDLTFDRAETASRNDSEPSSATSPAKSQIPVEKIIDLYKEVLPTLPQPRGVSETNKRAIKMRWEEYRKAGAFKPFMKGGISEENAGLEFFRQFFEAVTQSPFLMGEKTDFQASLPWLMGIRNFAKVLDGVYHRSSKKKSNVVHLPVAPRPEAASEQDQRRARLMAEVKELEEKIRDEQFSLAGIEKTVASGCDPKVREGLEQQAARIREYKAIHESRLKELRRDLGLSPLPAFISSSH